MNEIVKQDMASALEQVLVGGNLAELSPAQRVSYYQRVCESVGLNPLTRPLEYITLNGKLTLYARKDATDQLRKVNGISIAKPDISYQDDWIVVSVEASDQSGRRDSDIGVVNRKDMRGDFGNALMKAVTKAKRRVTLSICGLGMLDETEVETIPTAKPVLVTDAGEIVDAKASPTPQPGDAEEARTLALAKAAEIKTAKGTRLGDLSPDQLQTLIDAFEGKALTGEQAGMIAAAKLLRDYLTQGAAA